MSLRVIGVALTMLAGCAPHDVACRIYEARVEAFRACVADAKCQMTVDTYQDMLGTERNLAACREVER